MERLAAMGIFSMCIRKSLPNTFWTAVCGIQQDTICYRKVIISHLKLNNEEYHKYECVVPKRI